MKKILRKYLLFTQVGVIYSLPPCFINEKSKTEFAESQKSSQMNDPESQRGERLFGIYIYG